MADILEAFYKRLKSVLIASAPFTALVPAANISPDFNPEEPAAGALISYSFQQLQRDLKARRTRAQLLVTVESEQNKIKANAILDLFRTVATARTISGTGVTVHLFKETAGTSDALGVSQTGRFIVQGTWTVLMIEA